MQDQRVLRMKDQWVVRMKDQWVVRRKRALAALTNGRAEARL
jgi:hypothetical protein